MRERRREREVPSNIKQRSKRAKTSNDHPHHPQISTLRLDSPQKAKFSANDAQKHVSQCLDQLNTLRLGCERVLEHIEKDGADLNKHTLDALLTFTRVVHHTAAVNNAGKHSTAVFNMLLSEPRDS